jgi:group I intron endonuclease
MSYGYIYKTTNLLDNKIYIGQNKGKFTPYYYGSGLHIKRAINKYGRESFKLELIVCLPNREQLNEFEKFLISKYRDILGRDRLYNITNGGDGVEGFNHSEESKKAMSIFRSGKPRKHPQDCKCQWCKNKNGKRKHEENCSCVFCKNSRGESHLEGCQCIPCRMKRKEKIVHLATCQCCSCKAHRGEQRHTKEWKDNKSKKMMGHPVSNSTREKLKNNHLKHKSDCLCCICKKKRGQK